MAVSCPPNRLRAGELKLTPFDKATSTLTDWPVASLPNDSTSITVRVVARFDEGSAGVIGFRLGFCASQTDFTAFLGKICCA